MRIGIVGSGKIESTVGGLLARTGHEILFSSRHPKRLNAVVETVGHRAHAVTILEACARGNVTLVSIPFSAVPKFGQQFGEELDGKVTLEASNPYPHRDGPEAQKVIDSGLGTGPFIKQWLPKARVVRAFNTVWDRTLAKEAHRHAPRVGIPIASDQKHAFTVANELVHDAGFDAVVVGGLKDARLFDDGTSVYNKGMTAAEIVAVLKLPAEGRHGAIAS